MEYELFDYFKKKKKLQISLKLTLWTKSLSSCRHSHFRIWNVSTSDQGAVPTYCVRLHVKTVACPNIPNAVEDYDDACDDPFYVSIDKNHKQFYLIHFNFPPKLQTATNHFSSNFPRFNFVSPRKSSFPHVIKSTGGKITWCKQCVFVLRLSDKKTSVTATTTTTKKSKS